MFYTLFSNIIAHAELSIGALGGFANYTTNVRGDAIYAFGNGGYYQYPADINSNDFAGGVFIRYLYPLYPTASLGIETGYVYLNQDSTRLRADDLLPTPTAVENFTTKSHGLILLNLIARWTLMPCVHFSLFAGPVWLNTEYIANDFHDNIIRKAGSSYQPTVDVGVEANWDFMQNWSAGARLDNIFNTKTRTVAFTGSNGDPLLIKNTAKSEAAMFSLTIRYLIPCT